LHRYGQCGLHADDSDKIATSLYLYGHLIYVPEMLCLVALADEHVLQVSSDAFNVDSWVIIESACHLFFS